MNCPALGRKLTNPGDSKVTTGIANWGDCSLVCAQDSSCNHWQLEESSGQCTTMASYDYDLPQSGFVSGNSYCTSLSEYIGWVTCSSSDPNSGLGSSQKTTVRYLLSKGRVHLENDHFLMDWSINRGESINLWSTLAFFGPFLSRLRAFLGLFTT